MMSASKYCPQCGSEIVPGDRFCGDCGFDTHSIAAANVQAQPEIQPPAAPSIAAPNLYQSQSTSATAPQQPLGYHNIPPGAPFEPLGKRTAGNKSAVIIMVTILAAVFLGGGGLYWWFSRGEEPGQAASGVSATSTNGQRTPAPQQSTPAAAPEVDLSRAATYLAEPGLKGTFLVNYPDGMAGVVERISARVVPNETVRVSEVEIGVEQGEAYGYGFHYVERADGTYYILDQTPMEIFPELKNNIIVGQTWDYQDEFGRVVWKVMDVGVTLNLGFTTLKNCLLVEEDNQGVGLKTVMYYAPGMGRVMVRSSASGEELYKLTAFSQVGAAQAAEAVKAWAPNYLLIGDDRTQN